MSRYGEVAAAQTISTYPVISDFGRSGDPICDRFYVQVCCKSCAHVCADRFA